MQVAKVEVAKTAAFLQTWLVPIGNGTGTGTGNGNGNGDNSNSGNCGKLSKQ